MEEGKIADSAEKRDEERIFRERKEKIAALFRKNYNWISYIVLAVIVFIAVKIRTRNTAWLRDITTGGWTLGPDLDPFLFTRWAKDIVENGSLAAIDHLRYVPAGYNTKLELLLHPYMIAWFHKVAVIFGSSSVEQSAALYPVFFFAITVIAFFFLTRKIFLSELGATKSNIIALIASLFLSVLPPILPRTIAGIPEKESAAFFFLFMSIYLFLCAWKSRQKYGKYVLAVLAGVFTAGMALIWGGFGYIFLTLSIAVFIAFFLGHVDKQKFYITLTWVLASFALMFPFSARYSVRGIFVSTSTAPAIAVLFIILVHFLIWGTGLRRYFSSSKFSRIPKVVISAVTGVVLGLIVTSILEGPGFIFSKLNGVFNSLVKPATSRLIQTVAENRQPYFGEWSNSFGPIFQGFPVFFWLFFIGSVYLFYNMVRTLKKKEKWILTTAYLIFLVSIIFSRYSPSRLLNGENFASLSLYFGGILLFVICIGFYYYKYYKADELYKFKSIDFGLLVLFSFFILGIISARGAVRLIMMLVPPTSMIVSYFVVSAYGKVRKSKRTSGWKIIAWIIVGLLTIFTMFSAYQFYRISDSTAAGYIPSVYTQQWQRAMAWVRDNTSENAVFGHWWDYGYWIQSIGERATVLDGGNYISYWNHFMGRYALTGTNDREALEFLYAHDTTHFLIDSSDIGKYGAFSNIGSDVNYDRRSWIPTFARDNSRILETKNKTTYFYGVGQGSTLDEDLLIELEGKKIFLPGLGDGNNNGQNLAGVGAIRVEVDKNTNEISQPVGIFVYAGNQYEIPMRYAYYEGEFTDFGSGVEIGIFLMPRVVQNNNQLEILPNDVLLYLSARTVKSQLARLYLYGEDNPYFKTAHVEDDIVISQIKSQGVDIGDFVYFQGVRGPIKIWEIHYPSDIKLNEEFLERVYPEELKRA